MIGIAQNCHNTFRILNTTVVVFYQVHPKLLLAAGENSQGGQL